MSHTYHKPIGVQVVAWIEVVWGALVVLGGILISSGNGNPNMDPGASAAFGLFAAAIGGLMIAAGLGLRAMRRWALITNLACLGWTIFSGIVGARILEVLVAGAIMAYLLKVREAFYVTDEIQNLSLAARTEEDAVAPLQCATSATK